MRTDTALRPRRLLGADDNVPVSFTWVPENAAGLATMVLRLVSLYGLQSWLPLSNLSAVSLGQGLFNETLRDAEAE